MRTLRENLIAKIGQYRDDAAAIARRIPATANKTTAFGLDVLSETLGNIAYQLDQLLPPHNPKAAAELRRLFPWSEEEVRRQHQIRQLRQNRIRLNRGGAA